MHSKPLLFILCLSSIAELLGQSSGQNYTLSPYSNFGLGEILNMNIAEAGYTGQTYSSNYGYSMSNPATLRNLSNTTFDFSLNYRYGITESVNASRDFKGGGLGYLNLALNILDKKILKFSDSNGKRKVVKVVPVKWNSYIGLAPVTSVGYNYTVESNTPFLNRTAHSGKGGVNLFDWGNSFSMGNHISLGYSAGYMFGQLTDRSVFSVPDSADLFVLDDETTINIKAWRHQAGFMYQGKIDSTYHKLGASVRWYGKATGADLRFSRIYGYTSGTLTSVDTLLVETNSAKSIDMPTGLGLGYTFQWRKRWSLGVDYYTEKWSNYSAFFQQGVKLTDREDLGVSFVWNPLDETPAKLKKTGVPVRLGIRMSNTQHQSANNTRVKEQSYYAGFGIPFTRRYYDGQILRSVINLRFDYLTRGSLVNGLAKEQFLIVTASFNMGDVWFQRRKFD